MGDGPLQRARAALRAPVKGALARVRNAFDTPLLVLIYHRVTTLPSDPQLLAVSPDNFRAQLRSLARDHDVVRFEDDWSRLRRRAVAVTFDDGYFDNAGDALSILEELRLPATFFVATGHVGTRRELWWDDLERLVLGDGDGRPSFTGPIPGGERTWPARTPEERRALYLDLHALCMRSGAEGREAVLERLRAWSGLGADGRASHRLVTLAELQRMARSDSATVGAHTVSHSALSALPAAAQWEELRRSREQLEGWTGRTIDVFSYPFGQRFDYTGETIALCKQAGFKKVAANFPGQVHRWTDPYQIPRCIVRNWGAPTFEAEIRRFWTC